MRLTTIGTGAAAPDPDRVNAGHLVDAGDVRLLLDCGSGVVHRMAALGMDWGGITHVALTHFDADHVTDLATLFVAWRWGQLPPRSSPITVLGPPGTDALLTRLSAALWDKLLAPGYAVHVQEMAFGERTMLGDVVLESRKVPHTDESVAYSVAHAGRRLVYTGDTGADTTFGAWAAGCDVLLSECSLPAAMAVPSHLTPELVGEMAAEAQPGLLVLTHFYPPVYRVDVPGIIARRYAGPVILAHDGFHVDVGSVPPLAAPSDA